MLCPGGHRSCIYMINGCKVALYLIEFCCNDGQFSSHALKNVARSDNEVLL